MRCTVFHMLIIDFQHLDLQGLGLGLGMFNIDYGCLHLSDYTCQINVVELNYKDL